MRLTKWRKNGGRSDLEYTYTADVVDGNARALAQLRIARVTSLHAKPGETEWRVSSRLLPDGARVEHGSRWKLREARLHAVEQFIAGLRTERERRDARAWLLAAHDPPQPPGRLRRWSFLSPGDIPKDTDCVCSWLPPTLGTCELFRDRGVCIVLDFYARTLHAMRDPSRQGPTVGLTTDEARAIWEMLRPGLGPRLTPSPWNELEPAIRRRMGVDDD